MIRHLSRSTLLIMSLTAVAAFAELPKAKPPTQGGTSKPPSAQIGSNAPGASTLGAPNASQLGGGLGQGQFGNAQQFGATRQQSGASSGLSVGDIVGILFENDGSSFGHRLLKVGTTVLLSSVRLPGISYSIMGQRGNLTQAVMGQIPQAYIGAPPTCVTGQNSSSQNPVGHSAINGQIFNR